MENKKDVDHKSNTNPVHELVIKPCPFCGNEAKIIIQICESKTILNNKEYFREQIDYFFRCYHPKCDVKPFSKKFCSKEHAIKCWNKRAL